jgi:hypothetical protein
VIAGMFIRLVMAARSFAPSAGASQYYIGIARNGLIDLRASTPQNPLQAAGRNMSISAEPTSILRLKLY